jgi:hypothetical protein
MYTNFKHQQLWNAYCEKVMLIDLSFCSPDFFLSCAGCWQCEHHHCPSIDRKGLFKFVLHSDLLILHMIVFLSVPREVVIVYFSEIKHLRFTINSITKASCDWFTFLFFNKQDPTQQTDIDNFMVQKLDGTVNEWGWCKQKVLSPTMLLIYHLY